MVNLEGIYLSSNQLTGGIPHEISNLVNNPVYKDVLVEMRGLVAKRMEEVGDDKSLSGEPRYLKDHTLP